MNNDKHRVTFKLNKEVRDEMFKAISEDGYGMRGKARWVSEAIEHLIEKENYLELMDIGLDQVKDLIPKPEGIYVSEDLRIKLDMALQILRRTYPQWQSSQSAIVRTAIFQRLLRRY